MNSIKRIGYFSFMSVAALLILVIIMGMRQHQLSERYNEIITESETIIFQFATIREQITTNLISHNWKQVGYAGDQLKKLNSSLSRIQENNLIPGEYRLDLAKQADISSLAILCREISTDNPGTDTKIDKSLELQTSMRTLAEYFNGFDRIIVSRLRSQVVGFQTVMIGALAAVICIISFTLTLFYKNTMLPLFHLLKQFGQSPLPVEGFESHPKSGSEIVTLTEKINDLLIRNNESSPCKDEQQMNEQFANVLNESTNLANGIINYAQLLEDSYREVEMGNEEHKILDSIIETAERIARLNQEI